MVLVVFRSPDRARQVGEKFGRYIPALSVEAALRLAGKVRPRVIVLDVFAGTSTARAVDAVPRLSAVAPVVICTNRPDEGAVSQALALGAVGVVYRYDEQFAERVNAFVEGADRLPGRRPASRRAMH